MQHDDKELSKREKQLRSWSEQDQTEIDGFLRHALSRRDGRRYVQWLLEMSNGLGLEQNIFTGNALTTAHATGVHEIGKRIFAHLLDVAPDEFLLMLKENASESRERTVALARITERAAQPFTGPDAYTGPEPLSGTAKGADDYPVDTGAD